MEVTGFIGTPAFRTGTPQYDALIARIEMLVARVVKLSADEVKPAGWPGSRRARGSATGGGART